MEYRPYQQAAFRDIRAAYGAGAKRPLYVLPTGGGKTCIFSEITRGAAAKGNRVLIAAHRSELLDQISDALKLVSVPHGFVAADYPRSAHQTLVASVQTLIRRLDTTPEPQLIVLDEAHHALAETWKTILEHWPNAKVLGVTATPMRTSGEGLIKIFDRMIIGPTIKELTEQGYLCPARVFVPPTMDTSGLHIRMGDYVVSEAEALANKPAVTGSALDEYRKRANGKRALAFCVSVAHAHDVAKSFRAAGYSALALDGTTDRGIRRQAVADFKRGAIQIMTSADLFSEGFDSPGVEVGIMLRPTASLPLYLQQIGRCLRPAEGKTEALIFDHANNIKLFGMPDSLREWTLEGETKKKRERKVNAKVCPNCWAANQMWVRACVECGHDFPIRSRQIEMRDGELVEYAGDAPKGEFAKLMSRLEQAKANSLEALIKIGRQRGYRGDTWARRVWAARQAKRASA